MITRAHKRTLNRALHELRRPLQALVLMEEASPQPAASPPAASRRGLLEVAASALRDLDGAVNGDSPCREPGRFSCREVVMAALERWRPIAAPTGGIRVYWDAGPATVEGDAVRMAQALDNLISNALEHGGPPMVVTGARVAGRIRVTIANGASSKTRKHGPRPSPRARHRSGLGGCERAPRPLRSLSDAQRLRRGARVAAGRAGLRAGGVRRRRRAVLFLVAAIVCGLLAAMVAGRYRSRVEARYGPLRPVVVATAELPVGQPIGRATRRDQR